MTLRQLNFHHLRYFWAVASEGSIRAASQLLHVTQPTISGQLRQLEDQLGAQLFHREGRGLRLSETGQVVYRHAESIFAMGDALLDALDERPPGHSRRFVVGVAELMPKMATVQLLRPVLADPTLRLVIQEDPTESLLQRLESHALDAVLTDHAPAPTLLPRAQASALADSPICLFAHPRLAQRLRRDWPLSLDQAPVLLPQAQNPVRLGLDRWFRRIGVRPDLVAECDDSALIKQLGAEGFGAFPATASVSEAVCRQYGVEELGQAQGVVEQIWLVVREAQMDDPAVRAIQDAAQRGQKLAPG